MGKKLTSLLLGAIVTLVFALPAQAQRLQGLTRADMKAMMLQQKQAPGFDKQQSKKIADLKKQNPRIFQRKSVKPSFTNMMQTAIPTIMPRMNNVRSDANRFILKATGTSAIANFAYYPGMGDYDPTIIGRFSIGSPTEYSPLTNASYSFNAGATIQDGVYYGVNFDSSWYSFFGIIFVDLYKYDMETWEYLGSESLSGEGDDFSFVADETATAADGTTYGVFWTADASGSELCVVDYATLSRTAIGAIENSYVALGITKDGQLYGVATDANLYKIDKTTAQETLVGPTGVAVADANGSYYYQCGEIDQTDDTFYWLAVDVNTGITTLYSVDLNTGATTAINEVGEYNILGLCIEGPAANDGAPAKITDLTTTFVNGGTTGTVNFTAPTETYAGGELTGELTYTILNGEETLATGTTTPGAAVSLEVTLPEGMQTITAIVSNAEGDSPKAKTTFWVGFDIPQPPTQVTFTLDGNVANVSWTAPAAGIHEGFLGDITYDVYRFQGSDSTLVAEGISETSFSETLEVGELAIYSYGIVAKNDTIKSEMSYSEGQALGNALTVPYFADFTSQTTFNLFTVLDSNQDLNTWAWSSSYYAYYHYDGNNTGDDWLITPPIQLQAGKVYDVTAEIASNGTTFPERFEIMMGSQATPSELTTTIVGPTDVSITEFLPYEGKATVAEDGTYYFAIHAISDPDMWYLKVKSLSIEMGPEPTAPAALTDVAVTPNQEGLNEATITFTAPTKNIAGDDLTENLTKVEIYRDNALIGTVEDIAPGAQASYLDNAEDLTAGAHTYQLYPYNASGVGLKSEKISTFLGFDIPAIDEIATIDNFQSVTLSWDPAVGANGGIVDPAKTSYLVWDLVVTSSGLGYGEQLDSISAQTTCDVTYDTTVGEQGYKYWGVQPVNETGEGQTTVAAVIVGQPNVLPLEEHFPGNFQLPTWFYGRSNSSDVELGIMEASTDGDGNSLGIQAKAAGSWAWIMPGKTSVAGIVNPVMLFDVAGSTSLSKVYVVIATPDGTEKKITADIIPGEEFQTVKVDLKEFADQVYILPYIYAEFEEAGVVAIDNVNFVDFMEYNLAAAGITAPAAISAGTEANIVVTVKNWGENAAEGYGLKVSVADEVILEETVSEPLASLETKAFEVKYPTTIFTEAGDKTIKAEVVYDLDLDLDNNVTDAVITVNASPAAGVENLTAEESHVTWSAPSVLTENKVENFENTENFPTFELGGITADIHEGQFGDWKLYDGDGADVYGWESATVSYANAGEPAAWMPFAPIQAGMGQDNYPPFSGSQIMMAQCAVPSGSTIVASDDWIISPELPGIAQTISFYGLQASSVDPSAASFYGYESFEIWVSSTDNNIESFQKIADGQITSDSWEKFSFDLPEGAKYFAIRHTSSDVFALFIDDVAYVTGGGEIAGYNVYVDEVLYKYVTDTSIDLDLPEGDHKVSVTVVYTNGTESAPVSISTTITAIESILATGKPVDIYTVDGILVRSQATSAAGLKAGVYVVNGKKAVVR